MLRGSLCVGGCSWCVESYLPLLCCVVLTGWNVAGVDEEVEGAVAGVACI